jgi:hypothetical protein
VSRLRSARRGDDVPWNRRSDCGFRLVRPQIKYGKPQLLLVDGQD